MINTTTFAKQVQEGLSKIAEVKLNAVKSEEMITLIFEQLATNMAEGEKTRINKFGDFDHVERSARKGRNPQTSEVIDIPASKAPRFKTAKGLKELVKNK